MLSVAASPQPSMQRASAAIAGAAAARQPPRPASPMRSHSTAAHLLDLDLDLGDVPGPSGKEEQQRPGQRHNSWTATTQARVTSLDLSMDDEGPFLAGTSRP